MDLIFEYNNSLTNILCENIIEQFDECSNSNIFNIPKNNSHWEKIERIIYKELLIRINDFKNKLINKIGISNLFDLLNKPLYTKNLCIQKINNTENMNNKKYNFIANRYNVITYIFYLNDKYDYGETIIKINDNDIIIKPKKGKLVLFPENINYPYKCILPTNNSQYIISGQLCYNNII
jgi:hypothetical protein